MKGRIQKAHMRKALSEINLDVGLSRLKGHPSRRVINALFSFFYSQDQNIKWRAVTWMGIFVVELANEDLETARNIMRRLMWNLNDESGGIGWGSPEAMGEILSRHKGLAEEYGSIFLSYLDKHGNYLELPMLQRGLLWGITRLAEADPQKVADSKPHLYPYLDSKDPSVRGHAVQVLGLIGNVKDEAYLLPLLKDTSTYMTYDENRTVERLVSEAAKEAIGKLKMAMGTLESSS